MSQPVMHRDWVLPVQQEGKVGQGTVQCWVSLLSFYSFTTLALGMNVQSRETMLINHLRFGQVTISPVKESEGENVC